MLNFFPELLNYSFLASFLLRIGIALLILSFLSTFFEKRKDVFEKLTNLKINLPKTVFYFLLFFGTVSVILIFIGLYTQLAVLISAAVLFNFMLLDIGKKKIFNYGSHFFLPIILITLSLLFFGAGPFAFDIPL